MTGQFPVHMAEKIELWPIDRLIPYARNARTHNDDQVAKIAASMTEFGFTNPILVDGTDGIIAGHGRLMAAQKLGLPDVPVVVLDYLTDAQRRAYILADNRLALDAGWDEEMLAAELADLREMEFDLDLTGFSDDELSDLLSLNDDESGGEGLTDEDECGEPPVDPITKTGDVWIMGKHRLMCGDSTSIESVEKLCDGVRVDILITDPPYNVAYEGKTKEALTIQNDAMSNDDFRQFLRDAFTAADTVMKPGAVFYIWHADSEGYNFRGACFDTGWKVRQCLIWNKDVMVMGRQDYHWKHEPCLYGWKEGSGHLWATDRKQTTILEFKRPSRNAEHPTMKPVALFEYQLLNNTKGQDIVLDLFGGSGTTLIAAEKNNRYSRLMELDSKYCDVIVKRWQEFTGKDATLESTGETFNSLKTETEVIE